MGLQKSITNKYGSSTEYWIVTSVALSPQAKAANVKLSGWISQAARNDSEKGPIDSRNFIIHGDNFDIYFGNNSLIAQDASPQKNAYMYIKSIANGEFSDATDII